MGKTRKYHTCSKCRHYVFYQAQNKGCPKCLTPYCDTDVSHWQGNSWIRDGSSSPSTAKEAPKDKAGYKGGGNGTGKGSGKGGGSGGDSCGGTCVQGCSYTYESDMRDLGLDSHDIGMLVYIDGLTREAMDHMSDVPRHAAWKPLLQRVCLRKFPVQDEEKSLDVRLDKARKQVTRLEKSLIAARDARETAQAALDATKLEEETAESELEKAKYQSTM